MEETDPEVSDQCAEVIPGNEMGAPTSECAWDRGHQGSATQALGSREQVWVVVWVG